MPIEIYASASAVTPTSSWKCPDGVTRIFVECWGAGGGGGSNAQTNADGGGGGGGGAYAAAWLRVSPNQTYSYVIGGSGSLGAAGGNAGGPGGDSWFLSPTTVKGAGGGGGQPGAGTTPGAGGAGGTLANSFGTWKWAGGSGGAGRNSTTGRGGTGGSSAGPELFPVQYSGTGYSPYSISGSTGVSPGQTVANTTPSAPAPAFRAGPGGKAAEVLSAAGVKPTYGPGGGDSGCSEGTGVAGADGWSGQVAITWMRQSPIAMLLQSQDELNP